MNETEMQSELTYVRKKVYDPFLRFMHWILAFSITVLLATAWSSELFEKGPYEKAVWLIHIYTGYILIVTLAARILWGVIGPQHARFSDFWHPREWLRFQFKSRSRFGHHPMASALYLLLYGIFLMMGATGLTLAATEHTTGPLANWLSDHVRLGETFGEIHESLSFSVACFIVLHIGSMILHERIEKTPISQAMLSGFQYKRKEDFSDN